MGKPKAFRHRERTTRLQEVMAGLAASKALSRELMRLTQEPVPGFTVEPSSDDLFTWVVGMFGPPDTIYAGGYFKAKLKFPETYPMEPPTMTMLHPMWHPNIFENGKLCISILHPPGDDPTSGELASERWNPTQSVSTVFLSVISTLNEPNISSPANVDASVMYRSKREEYDARVCEQVEASKLLAKREGVVVPTTVDDYVIKAPEYEACLAESSDDEKYIVQLDEDSDDSDKEDNEDEDYGAKKEEVAASPSHSRKRSADGESVASPEGEK